ncbi:MAG: hypothetical protein IAE79_05335 [Anaerolinea sp.]|nr:hypothetical protein [Anaerolinea sp.]
MSMLQAYHGIIRKGRIHITPPADLPEEGEFYLWVTERTAQETAVPDILYTNPDYAAMEQEQAAFHRMLPDLLRQYKGQYVAIYRGEVIDHDLDQTDLVVRLDQTHPDDVVLVKLVTDKPGRVLRMPSPRLVRDE